MDRDLAAHTLAMLLEQAGLKTTGDNAGAFLNYLIQSRSQQGVVSLQCLTHSLMFLLKINEVAEQFIRKRGFDIYSTLLQNECNTDAQIAYNVCCGLWILSSNPAALDSFRDFQLNIIESISKILDFSNKEKIVRIICMIFDVSAPPAPPPRALPSQPPMGLPRERKRVADDVV